MSKPFAPVSFGRYVLTERIAIGGMAEIFAGKIHGAMGFEKPVVIKRILPQLAEDEEFLRMFVTEAKLVCHLEHPNVVQVYELGEIDGQYYIAMEYVNGIDCRHLWRTLAKRKQRLPAMLAMFIVAEFLKGLDYAHRTVDPDHGVHGVVHRDVSPSNVLLSFRGDVKIGDFGIALVQQESKSQAGVLKGKYGYMSPEQVAGLPVDHRSDVFAAGIVLAELLLGRRLFLGRSDFETLDKVLNVRLDILEKHEAALPADVIAVVRGALQREPDDRFTSARAFHDALMDLLFQQRQRVTTETLAGFIERHVVPYLPPKEPADGSISVSDVSAAAASSTGLPREAGVAAVAPSAPPAAAPPAPEPPAPEPPAAARPEARRRPLTVELPGVSPPEGTEGVGAPTDEPALPLWDNVVDLEPEGISAAGADSTPAGVAALGIGEELDLSGPLSGEVNISAFTTAEPDALVEARLAPAEVAAVDAEDRADFTGALGVRTVTRVLFRFSVAQETGLLSLTGVEKPDAEQADLVDWIEGMRRTSTGGQPSMTAQQRTCEIHLEDGAPHLVAADRSEEELVSFLVRTGELDRRLVEKAIRRHPQRGVLTALLTEGLVRPLQTSRHVTAFVLASVEQTFSWDDGSFAFHRGRDCSREAFPTGLAMLELIRRGVDLLPEAYLDSHLAKLAGQVLTLNPTPAVFLDDFAPEGALRGVYEALRAPQDVAGLLRRCTQLAAPAAIKRAAYLLLECEMVLTG